MTEMMKYVMEEECNEQYIDALLLQFPSLPFIVSSFPLPSVYVTITSFKRGMQLWVHNLIPTYFCF